MRMKGVVLSALLFFDSETQSDASSVFIPLLFHPETGIYS
jgi:hypothetical protein